MSAFNKSVNGKTLHFAPVGVLDANNSPLLQDEIDESLEGMTEVVFDLADLTYISSAGLRVLLATQKNLGRTGNVRVKNASEEIRVVMTVTRIANFVTVD